MLVGMMAIVVGGVGLEGGAVLGFAASTPFWDPAWGSRVARVVGMLTSYLGLFASLPGIAIGIVMQRRRQRQSGG